MRVPRWLRVTMLAIASICLVLGSGHPSLGADLATTYCGQVKAYQPPVSANPPSGSATIGAQTIPVAFGSNATITVGANICLTGTYNPQGILTNYAVVPIPATYCGKVAEFVAPTGSTNGHIALASPTTVFTFKIPAGTTVSRDDAQGDRCAALAIDSLRGAIVHDLTAAAAPSALPSTASSPSSPPIVPALIFAAIGLIAVGMLSRVAAARRN